MQMCVIGKKCVAGGEEDYPTYVSQRNHKSSCLNSQVTNPFIVAGISTQTVKDCVEKELDKPLKEFLS